MESFWSIPTAELLGGLEATIAVITLVFPFTPLGTIFGFSPLQLSTYLLLLMIVILYILAAEITKRVFYKKVKF